MRLGIVEYIDCAHFLPDHPKCGTIHGHTYKIEIVIEGERERGMILDFADLRQTTRAVLAEYDHRSWNDSIEFPSVENICELLAQRISARLSFAFVIKVWEGQGKWAEMSHPGRAV
ncbi:MAG: 6-carboxytetrahydropterin synthase [Vicinamibacteria bacterium]|jgi:6-pyruvoyltetrahydropterin/6-carboxytetrahydropterin synthase|nr:6-carboxytetrahydropterin synthase [Vicinamibacteria bacterium]